MHISIKGEENDIPWSEPVRSTLPTFVNVTSWSSLPLLIRIWIWSFCPIHTRECGPSFWERYFFTLCSDFVTLSTTTPTLSQMPAVHMQISSAPAQNWLPAFRYICCTIVLWFCLKPPPPIYCQVWCLTLYTYPFLKILCHRQRTEVRQYV